MMMTMTTRRTRRARRKMTRTRTADRWVAQLRAALPPARLRLQSWWPPSRQCPTGCSPWLCEAAPLRATGMGMGTPSIARRQQALPALAPLPQLACASPVLMCCVAWRALPPCRCSSRHPAMARLLCPLQRRRRLLATAVSFHPDRPCCSHRLCLLACLPQHRLLLRSLHLQLHLRLQAPRLSLLPRPLQCTQASTMPWASASAVTITTSIRTSTLRTQPCGPATLPTSHRCWLWRLVAAPVPARMHRTPAPPRLCTGSLPLRVPAALLQPLRRLTAECSMLRQSQDWDLDLGLLIQDCCRRPRLHLAVLSPRSTHQVTLCCSLRAPQLQPMALWISDLRWRLLLVQATAHCLHWAQRRPKGRSLRRAAAPAALVTARCRRSERRLALQKGRKAAKGQAMQQRCQQAQTRPVQRLLSRLQPLHLATQRRFLQVLTLLHPSTQPRRQPLAHRAATQPRCPPALIQSAQPPVRPRGTRQPCPPQP